MLTLLSLHPSAAGADITFTNGKWETTFDCPEWAQGAALSIDQTQVLFAAGAHQGATWDKIVLVLAPWIGDGSPIAQTIASALRVTLALVPTRPCRRRAS